MTKATPYHILILVCSLVVLLLSFLLRFDEHGLHLHGMDHVVVPDVCFFKMATGWDCLFCGLTRSFVAITHGQLHLAYEYHRLSFLAMLIVLGQLPYRIALICRPSLKHHRVMRSLQRWTLPVFMGLALINWIVSIWL
ncbi:MAG: hypothetical protein CMJ19_19685 [Phycisphaeraceae bacterium]|nr:hypothetical protein [Phycisphaeraceae bacterium]|tara:strand:+ start:589 stop:1002 length:414 start_codon:yes stop_codon:yes gene_type:complete